MVNRYVLRYDRATGRPRSYRKYILQISQPSQYRYAKLQYRFAVISGSPSMPVTTYAHSKIHNTLQYSTLRLPGEFHKYAFVLLVYVIRSPASAVQKINTKNNINSIKDLNLRLRDMSYLIV